MEKIWVNGSKLCSNGTIIKLSGVSIPDYFWLTGKENQDIEVVMRKIKELGFNAVRVPVLPGNFLFYDDYIERIIRKVVDLSAELELYCILDWHAIGNPLHEQTRLKEFFHLRGNHKIYWYSANKETAAEGLAALSGLFGRCEHVIFEIYNEPCPAEKEIPQLELSALPWTDWRKIAKELISVVRKDSENLVLVSSNYWAFNLKSASDEPFSEYQNIAYSFHCYPLRNNKNWREMLDSMRELPVVVTEFGYDTDEKSQYKSSDEDYFEPFMGYLKEHNISWVGWCFSSSWRPRIVSKWQPLELSDFGRNLVEQID